MWFCVVLCRFVSFCNAYPEGQAATYLIATLQTRTGANLPGFASQEIGFTPQDKLQIVTHGFDARDVASAFGVIDVANAQCFDMTAKARHVLFVCKKKKNVVVVV